MMPCFNDATHLMKATTIILPLELDFYVHYNLGWSQRTWVFDRKSLCSQKLDSSVSNHKYMTKLHYPTRAILGRSRI